MYALLLIRLRAVKMHGIAEPLRSPKRGRVVFLQALVETTVEAVGPGKKVLVVQQVLLDEMTL